MALLGVVGTLGGCATAGRDFPRPTPETAVVGQTTNEQIRLTFGVPREEHTYSATSSTADALSGSEKSATTSTRTRLWYFFADPMAATNSPGAIAQRRGSFYFTGGKLVSYHYSSTFKADSTDFNEALVSKLERDRTTLSEAEEILGKPSGMGVKPATGDDVGTQHYYTYWYVEVNKIEHVITEKRLQLFFAPANVLADYKLTTTRKPYEPRNKVTPIPIFIPIK